MTEKPGLLSSKWSCVIVLSIAEVMAMAVWFSASAVLPALKREFALTDGWGAVLASAVSIGFVAGTLGSALLGLADRLDQRRFFAVAAVIAAAANAGMLVLDPQSLWVVALRFVVGACAAGIYPVGMRMVAAWARLDMGLLVGLLVGAQVLGLASPHLIDAIGGFDWRLTLISASILALAAGALVNVVSLGPNLSRPVAFRARFVMNAWRQTSIRLANLGYLGHMWELFAMWGWVGLFLVASFELQPGGADAIWWAKLAAFGAVAMGGPGCLIGGFLADRYGRTTVAIGALAISGLCSATVGLLYGGNPVLLTALCLVWGAAVVADSPQFTASIAELSEPHLIGTMITIQTCLGFLLTTATIHLVPLLVEHLGWSHAFLVLAIGPVFGIAAMMRLRRHPDAVRLANGNR